MVLKSKQHQFSKPVFHVFDFLPWFSLIRINNMILRNHPWMATEAVTELNVLAQSNPLFLKENNGLLD